LFDQLGATRTVPAIHFRILFLIIYSFYSAWKNLSHNWEQCVCENTRWLWRTYSVRLLLFGLANSKKSLLCEGRSEP